MSVTATRETFLPVAGPARESSHQDARLAYLAAVTIVMWISATYSLVAWGLLVSAPVSGIHLAGGFFLAGIFAIRAAGWRWNASSLREAAATSILLAAIIVASAGYAETFDDLSSDGQEYHQSAILKLAEGWNPNTHLITERESVHDRWLNYYPKSAWYVAASLPASGANIELAKAFNVLIAVAAALLIYAAARSWLSRLTAAVVAALAALNGVTVCQLSSFYIDGQVASAWLALVALAAIWVRSPDWKTSVPIAGCCCYLVGLKYTGLVFAGAVFGCVFLSLAVRHQRPLARQWLWVSAVSMVVSVVTGYNPYITNVIRRGNPFYLLIGADAYHYVSNRGPNGCCVPPGFQDRDRLSGLAISLLSASENNSGYAPPRYKLPFTVRTGELRDFFLPDVRLGGWGPLMGSAMLVAGVGLVLLRRRRPGRWPLWVPDSVLLPLTAILLIPYPFWARYAPMVAFIPVAVLAEIWMCEKRDRLLEVTSLGLALTLVLNLVLVSYAHIHQQVEATKALRQQIYEMAQLAEPIQLRVGPTESTRYRLQRSGVRFREVDEFSCTPQKVLFAEAEFCEPVQIGR